MRLWSIEGNRQRLDGGAMFGSVPKALWAQWMTADELNRVELACRALLVEDLTGQRVLFEAGIGVFFEPKLKQRFGVDENTHRLLESLQRLGCAHTDIDAVVLSHLHFDHAGGILAEWHATKPARLLFPNARFLVSRAAWERARQPHPRDRASFIPELPGLLEDSGRLELIDAEQTATLGERVRFSFSHGHTPGLMHAEIGGAGGVVICADLIPGRRWVHVPVTSGFDRSPERLSDEKRCFLEDKLARGVRLFFSHDPDCALATPVRDDRGRYTTTDERAEVDGLEIC